MLKDETMHKELMKHTVCVCVCVRVCMRTCMPTSVYLHKSRLSRWHSRWVPQCPLQFTNSLFNCVLPKMCSFFFFFFKLYLFIFWLCWVFVSVRGLPLVVASGGHSSSRCAGLSLSRPLLLWSTGSRCTGSVIVAHGPSCSAACGILPDQGSNPCPLH